MGQVRFDIRNLIFISKTDHLECPICQQPYLNPYTTVCGHTFCQECLWETLRLSPKCPLDRTPINRENRYDVSPAPVIVKNITDELQVKCIYDKKGCEWRGGRCEVESHLDRECGFCEVECPCGCFLERRYLKDEECAHKLISCNFCKSEVAKMDMDEHLTEACTENLIKCVNCSNKVTANMMKIHQQECDNLFVPCSAQMYGCNWRGSEKALTAHSKECALYSLVPYLECQAKKTDEVTKENSRLRRQMTMILDGVIGGRMDTSHTAEADYFHLMMEMERVQLDVDSLRRNDNTVVRGLVNDCMALKDEMSSQRAIIHSLRMQLQFLILERRTEAKLNTKL